jgi:serine protease Do
LPLVLALTICSVRFAVPVQAQDDLAEQEEAAIRAAVQAVAPSVVKIETIGGLESVGGVLVSTGPTTGLVVADDGYVVSSSFNFVQQPSSILVTLPSGARAAAQIVARDHSRMLVLLKVNTTEKLPVPAAAPRAEMTVGQWAIAVGRTFNQQEPNISVGVLSATNRIWSTAIQTDAKISPANYGGPLIDIRGRVR